MFDEVALSQVLGELSGQLKAHDFSAASATKPCDVWKTIRPGVLKLIQILNTLGAIFSKAKLAAQALEALRGLLDQLCNIGPVAATSAAPSDLDEELARALDPAAVPAAVSESPCDVWRRLRNVIAEIEAALKALAGDVPIFGEVADAIDAIAKLLDQLCGSQAGPSVAVQLAGLPSKSFAVGRQPQARVESKKRARNYIKYPSPEGLKPRTGGPFKVADLCAAYNFPTGLAGGGKIGILELGGGYKPSDLKMFASSNGLPTLQVTDRLISGGKNKPGGPADGEVLLDIQVAAAVYFYCTGQVPQINVYFAPNAGQSYLDVIQAAVADQCDVLSISWGGDEGAWPQADADLVEQAAEAATASGCVIFAASGDNSSSDGTAGANVDMPSSCPHVIGCGGTTKSPGLEVVWGDGTPNGRGTGGGFSSLFRIPAWQAGHLPAIAGSRMVPDVAADADPDTGYLVFINGKETQIGGTSAVAPLYAGLFAAFGRKLGFVAPKLWANAGAFEDIKEGSNGSFSAAFGPDPCTGLGVPKGDVLAKLFG